jgi:hypothetical protein
METEKVGDVVWYNVGNTKEDAKIAASNSYPSRQLENDN